MVKSRNPDPRFAILICSLYLLIFLSSIPALFHGLPDIERFFAEWMDERITLTTIMTFGTLNFAPNQIIHPPLYHYICFIPISLFFFIGKAAGLFSDKLDFLRFYFDQTQYFFLICRSISFLLFWLGGVFVYKICRLFSNRLMAHLTVLAYLLVPRFIFDFSTSRPETLLFFTTLLYFYLFLSYYKNPKNEKFLYFSAFFLGLAIATKYNALFLVSGFAVYFIQDFFNSIPLRKIIKKASLVLILIFIGFSVADPFFIIQFKKYFYNLNLLNTVEMKYYWKGYHPATFGLTHVLSLGSVNYLNFFGLLIVFSGFWKLFKAERRLFWIIFVISLVYESYFGIYLRNSSPLYFLNPLLPIGVLSFNYGLKSLDKNNRIVRLSLMFFFMIIIFKHATLLMSLASRPTYLQKTRAFIEKNIPEFSSICITSDHHLPQLNLTRSSYLNLLVTAPEKKANGSKIPYEEMSRQLSNEEQLREIRIESFTKKPQYNIIRLPEDIKSFQEALNFLKVNNIHFIICGEGGILNAKEIESRQAGSLIKSFRAKNDEIYEGAVLNILKIN